jgi:glutathione S-transferase
MRPAAISPGDPDGAKAVALKQVAEHAIAVDRRLGRGAWWYGADWSIVDTFVAWAFGLAAAMGSDLSAYPHLLAHRRAAEALPAFTATRALEIDIAEREGLTGPPGIVL